jgi:hypothetical protein
MNKTEKTLSYSEEKAILIYLGEIYNKAHTITELYKQEENLTRTPVWINQQASLVKLIECTLNSCTPGTRFIIIHSFLRKDPSDWYIPYYSKSSFFRMKRIAVDEFTKSFMRLKD